MMNVLALIENRRRFGICEDGIANLAKQQNDLRPNESFLLQLFGEPDVKIEIKRNQILYAIESSMMNGKESFFWTLKFWSPKLEIAESFTAQLLPILSCSISCSKAFHNQNFVKRFRENDGLNSLQYLEED